MPKDGGTLTEMETGEESWVSATAWEAPRDFVRERAEQTVLNSV